MPKPKNNVKLCFFAGCTLILLSFLLKDIPKTPHWITVPSIANFMGIIYLGEAITRKFRNFSLFNHIVRNPKNLIAFLIVVVVNAVVLDGIMKYAGKLWIYPHWRTIDYATMILPAFTLYWLAIAESYLGLKTLVDYFTKGRHVIYKPLKIEKYLYPVLCAAGIIMIFWSVFIISEDYRGQVMPYFTTTEVFDISGSYAPPARVVIFIFTGLWFILEYIEYRRKRGSLIEDIVHQYFAPLIAIFLGVVVTGSIVEFHNIPVEGWIFTNMPYPEINFLGLPASVFLFWLLHYLVFLSLFRIIVKRETLEIWRGDLIE